MAILDYNLSFSTVTAGANVAYAPTAATTENLFPNSIDTAPLGLPSGSGGGSATGYNAGVGVNAGRDLGVGGEMWLEVLVVASVAQTSGGVKFELVTDSVATLANVVSTTNVGVLLVSPNFTAAQLVAQAYWRTQLPASLSYLEFIGVDVYITSNNMTAGSFLAYLLNNIQESDLYLSGIALQ